MWGRSYVGGAVADVVVNPVPRGGWRGGGACLVRRDVDGVFAGQKHPTRRTRPQGGVGTQRGGLCLHTHTNEHTESHLWASTTAAVRQTREEAEILCSESSISELCDIILRDCKAQWTLPVQCDVTSFRQVKHGGAEEAYRCRISESKVSHLFDVNMVVEVDQVSSLLLTHSGRGRGLVGGVGGGGGGAARLGAATSDRNRADVSTCWRKGGEKCVNPTNREKM